MHFNTNHIFIETRNKQRKKLKKCAIRTRIFVRHTEHRPKTEEEVEKKLQSAVEYIQCEFEHLFLGINIFKKKKTIRKLVVLAF